MSLIESFRKNIDEFGWFVTMAGTVLMGLFALAGTLMVVILAIVGLAHLGSLIVGASAGLLVSLGMGLLVLAMILVILFVAGAIVLWLLDR